MELTCGSCGGALGRQCHKCWSLGQDDLLKRSESSIRTVYRLQNEIKLNEGTTKKLQALATSWDREALKFEKKEPLVTKAMHRCASALRRTLSAALRE